MQEPSVQFRTRKKNSLSKLKDAAASGKVDAEIVELLEVINNHPYYFTTSSCSGRIQIVSSRRTGDKATAVVHGKWHGEVQPDELYNIILEASRTGHIVQMMFQGPIIHITSEDIAYAKDLLVKARASGFKNSSIRYLHKDGTVNIELLSTEYFALPVAAEGRVWIPKEYVELFCQECKMLRNAYTVKLKKLREKLIRCQSEA
ncbi:MAG: hypothetical protein QW728_07935 [Thermoplasmata archaeon]